MGLKFSEEFLPQIPKKTLGEFGLALKVIVDRLIINHRLVDPFEIYYLAFRRLTRTPNYSDTLFSTKPDLQNDDGPYLIFDPNKGAISWSYCSFANREVTPAEAAIITQQHLMIHKEGILFGLFNENGDEYIYGE